jgi:hypothetical protein
MQNEQTYTHVQRKEREQILIEKKRMRKKKNSLFRTVELFVRHKYTCNSISLSLTRVFIIDAMIEKHAQMNVATHRMCISIGEPSNYQGLRKEKENSTKTEKEKDNDDVCRRSDKSLVSTGCVHLSKENVFNRSTSINTGTSYISICQNRKKKRENLSLNQYKYHLSFI